MAGINGAMHRTGTWFVLALEVCMMLRQVEQRGRGRVKDWAIHCLKDAHCDLRAFACEAGLRDRMLR
jgi:hypothetical protein